MLALAPEQRAERGDYVGCIAGAPSFAEYRASLEAAGFTGIEITPTHSVADGMHSAIIRATKPAAPDMASSSDPTLTVTEVQGMWACGCRS
ncbi:hypothetical protein [Streptomyces yanii]|uniref:Uncharacterized protein n=1 Tax=Streptomyces yanii TaxID=78510 RepID=A0ABV5RPC2_9ACTN